MAAGTFDLAARPHASTTLMRWLDSRGPDAVKRAGVQNVTTVTGNLSGLSWDEAAELGIFGPVGNPSGFAVTEHTAMLVGTVYACLSKLAGAITQLPLHEYLRTDNGRERAKLSPVWWMLNEAPNPDDTWTASSWKEFVSYCVHLRGDQHTQIIRGRGAALGQIVALKPHHPDNVHASRDSKTGRVRYDCLDPITGRVTGVDPDDMLHFSGFGFDGVRSISAIMKAARTAIGNALATADYMGRNVGEGAMPRIALKYPNKLSPQAADRLRESFTNIYGSQAAGSRKVPLVMSEGGEAQILSIKPVDMELLATRVFEKHDICQALGVPPIMIGDSEKTSSWGSGVEQITLGFVRFTIKPHLTRWGEELNRKLYRRAGRYVEWELDGLLAGDSKAQSEYFRKALGGPGMGDGWMSVDEVRSLKNQPALGGAFATPYKAPADASTTPPGDSPDNPEDTP